MPNNSYDGLKNEIDSLKRDIEYQEFNKQKIRMDVEKINESISQGEHIDFHIFETRTNIQNCPNCGCYIEDNEANYCPECGFSLNSIHCPKCGKKLDKRSIFCDECGTKID